MRMFDRQRKNKPQRTALKGYFASDHPERGEFSFFGEESESWNLRTPHSRLSNRENIPCGRLVYIERIMGAQGFGF